jgi:5-methylcytosine-specific restriction enzyme subunit McrC
VVDEYRLKGMIVYDQNHNPLHRTPPVLRPDYVILKGHEPVAILDAKYRDLWENPLPREMLYQLSIYALIRFTREKSSVILYPTIKTNAREARIQILDPLTLQSRALVILRPVKLLSLESLLSQPQSLINFNQRQTFAQYLVFGNAPQMSTQLEPTRISVASSSL